jgi:hypothetical protein
MHVKAPCRATGAPKNRKHQQPEHRGHPSRLQLQNSVAERKARARLCSQRWHKSARKDLRRTSAHATGAFKKEMGVGRLRRHAQSTRGHCSCLCSRPALTDCRICVRGTPEAPAWFTRGAGRGSEVLVQGQGRCSQAHPRSGGQTMIRSAECKSNQHAQERGIQDAALCALRHDLLGGAHVRVRQHKSGACCASRRTDRRPQQKG